MLLLLVGPALQVRYIIVGNCDLEIANALCVKQIRPNSTIFVSRVLMLGLAQLQLEIMRLAPVLTKFFFKDL